MPRLKVRFDNPEHGWITFSLCDSAHTVLERDVSRIYDSFSELVTALLALVDGHGERVVVWMEEPAELEMRFLRGGDAVRLELTSFPNRLRPREKAVPDAVFEGSYESVCLPFWRALRALEGRHTPEKLIRLWKGYFPHRELSLLTRALGKE